VSGYCLCLSVSVVARKYREQRGLDIIIFIIFWVFQACVRKADFRWGHGQSWKKEKQADLTGN